MQAQPGARLPPEVHVLLVQPQIRLPECQGGVGISSMANAVKPDFYAATVRFIATPRGQILIPDSSKFPAPNPHPPNKHMASALDTNFSKWLSRVDTTEELRAVGPKLVREDDTIPAQDPAMFLPKLSTLVHQGGLMDLAVTIRRASDQHKLTL